MRTDHASPESGVVPVGHHRGAGATGTGAPVARGGDHRGLLERESGEDVRHIVIGRGVEALDHGCRARAAGLVVVVVELVPDSAVPTTSVSSHSRPAVRDHVDSHTAHVDDTASSVPTNDGGRDVFGRHGEAEVTTTGGPNPSVQAIVEIVGPDYPVDTRLEGTREFRGRAVRERARRAEFEATEIVHLQSAGGAVQSGETGVLTRVVREGSHVGGRGRGGQGLGRSGAGGEVCHGGGQSPEIGGLSGRRGDIGGRGTEGRELLEMKVRKL